MLVLASIPAHAQQTNATIKGSYVLTQEGMTPDGQPFTSLATFQFNENGSVSGTEMVLSRTGLARVALTGTYSFANGVGSLNLLSSSSDDDGNTVVNLSETYRMLATQNNEYNLIRNNIGYYSTAKLSPAASTANLTGSYQFSELGANRPFSRIVSLTFNGTASAKGFAIQENAGNEETVTLTGITQPNGDGFGTLVLTHSSTNADGDPVAVNENFLFLVTASDGARMMRADNTADGLIDLTK